MKIDVFKIEMSAPDDVRELKKLIDAGEVDPGEIIAVLGKTRETAVSTTLPGRCPPFHSDP